MLHFLSRLFGRLLFLVCVLALAAAVAVGGVYTFLGYSAYRDAVSERPIAQAMSEVQSQASYTPLDQVPLIYQQAVVAVEDRRFYDHNGFDAIGTSRALLVNLFSGEAQQGGSTITQQLAKNLYYGQDQSLTRKIAELFTSIQIERAYSKEDILAAYMSSIYYGDGYYTLADASWGYFGVAPSGMNDFQATLLAGVPNAPSVYAPTVNYDLARQRQRQVLGAMVEEGYLTEEAATAIDASGV